MQRVPAPFSNITALILAGGAARRMGGCAKALQPFGESTLLETIVRCLQGQVEHIAINANQQLTEHGQFGYPVWPDQQSQLLGPLAGVATGLAHCHTEFLLTVPCDSPFLPQDVVAKLYARMQQGQYDLVTVCTREADGSLQQHPVFCLMRPALARHLQTYMQAGGRKFSDWWRDLRVAFVEFDQPEAFRNLNTRQDLLDAQQHVTTTMIHSPFDFSGHAGYLANNLPLSVAQDIVRQHCPSNRGQETLGIRDALGRVLATDICANTPVPAHDNSAMDGFALMSNDLTIHADACRLQVVGSALAGHPFHGTLQAGQCIRIMTGAVVPPQCDTVIPHENVVSSSALEIVLAANSVKPGANRRRRGEDLAQGELAIAKGTLLQPAQIGMLASLGYSEVPVYERLRVAFFSTGDELRPLGSSLETGMLYDSNRYSLHALLSKLGCIVTDLGIVADQPAAIRNALEQARGQVDVVLTSGGMAGGDTDFTRSMMQELGDVHFWQLKMRPGRPFAFGRMQDAAGAATYLFGLPGNPVALMISFYMLVRPALLQMMGMQHSALPILQVAAQHAIRKAPGRHEFQRGIIQTDGEGNSHVSLTGAQGSAMLSSMSHANCLLALPPERGDIAEGELVPVILLDGLQ